MNTTSERTLHFHQRTCDAIGRADGVVDSSKIRILTEQHARLTVIPVGVIMVLSWAR
jgi:hypothetical protein